MNVWRQATNLKPTLGGGWADYLHCSHRRAVERLTIIQIRLLTGCWWSPGSDRGLRTFSTSERVAFSLRPSRKLDLHVFLYRTYVCRFRSSAESLRGKTTTTWASRDAFAPGWGSEERNEGSSTQTLTSTVSPSCSYFTFTPAWVTDGCFVATQTGGVSWSSHLFDFFTITSLHSHLFETLSCAIFLVFLVWEEKSIFPTLQKRFPS